MRFLAALFFALSILMVPLGPGGISFAQEKSGQERALRQIESHGFNNVSGLRRRGANYVFQAHDLSGDKVRVVMNAETGEIVGLSKVMPKKN